MSAVLNTLIMLSQGIPGLVVAGLAMILMLFALLKKDAGMMVFSALLVIPFAYAMGAWAGLLLFVRLLPLFPLLSAVAIGNDEPLFAWILPFPAFIYLIYLVFNLVLSNFAG